MVYDTDDYLHIAMTSNSGKFLMLGIDMLTHAFNYYIRTNTGPSQANSVVAD